MFALRLQKPFALALFALACGFHTPAAMSQEPSVQGSERPRSLAARLADLRASWGNQGSEAATEGTTQQPVLGNAPPQTTSTETASTGRRGYLAVAAESIGSSLPRVNPRNLLNSAKTEEKPAAEVASVPPTYTRGSTVGLSRTRPGTRYQQRSTPGSDVALDLGYQPRVASQPSLGNPSTGGNTESNATSTAPRGPFGIVPTPSASRVGSILGRANRAASDPAQRPTTSEAVRTGGDKVELIGSGAGSRDTSGFGFGNTADSANHESTGSGFGSAADAARRSSSPAPTTTVATDSAVDTKNLTADVAPSANAELARQIAAIPAIEMPVTEQPVIEKPATPTVTANSNPARTSEPVESDVAVTGNDGGARRAFSSQTITAREQAPVQTTTTTTAASNLLASNEMPLLVTQVVGPRKVVVGNEAKFAVQLANRGNATADRVTIGISIPEWARVVRTSSGQGVVRQTTNGLQWEMGRLAARSQESLQIILVPTEPQAIELGVTAQHAPVGASTRVEVQQPKLDLLVSGPTEVQFGHKQTYRMTVSNPGTGPASHVRLGVVPPGATAPAGHYRIDQLAAGETKIVEFDLTARQAGQLAVKVIAEADGGLKTEAQQSVMCRKAELALDWRGPQQKYAGTAATYYFRVRNNGTATADNTVLSVTLPAAFELQSASKGARYDAPGQRVTWSVGGLEAGTERFFELVGNVNQPGSNTMVLEASTKAGEAMDRKTATTEVIAVADLKLDIADPKGPLPVGKEVYYSVAVTNRGRSTAENVQVVALFSEGIEPMSVEGATATIANGRVGFPLITSMKPGEEVRYRVKAKSVDSGTHLFRAEVLCNDLDIKLAAEESTQFYVDESPTMQPSESVGLSIGGGESGTW